MVIRQRVTQNSVFFGPATFSWKKVENGYHLDLPTPHTHTVTVTEANEGLGWDPLLKHVMILVVTGNLGWGLDPRYHQDTIMFHLGSLVELP